MNALLPLLYILGLYAAYAAGSALLRFGSAQPELGPQATRSIVPATTLLLLLLVAVPTTLQFFLPGLLAALQRDPARFAQGEWWRLVTPLVVQDGGVGGALFNLVSLALVGALAEQLWGRMGTVLFFLVGGIAGEVVAFAWQPLGAGNSVGNFGIAASIAIACLTRRSSRLVQAAAWLALGADVVLAGLRDIHGAAALAAAVVALGVHHIRNA